jgi:bifunctional DNA-binding transcriptional regulator/antitoxin component of YhaV-PrlF toxin-antitoxin module
MLSKSITKLNRLWRLKNRLGWKPKRMRIRVKSGGWIILPRNLVHEMGWKVGDLLDWRVEGSSATLSKVQGLTATQVRQIKKRVPQGTKRSVRSSLFEETHT